MLKLIPTSPRNGVRKCIDGQQRVYYDGYWIRYYQPPPDSMEARRRLIQSLNRRTFHQTERGINTPGKNLEVARAAYENEQDPARKRVNAAMLAGALFNRATSIFHSLAEMSGRGVKVESDNTLMVQCGEYLQEALELGGKYVKHHSGRDGIDELWGEPLKAFSLPIEDFYCSRYIKISKGMRDIDEIADVLIALFKDAPGYAELEKHVRRHAKAARSACEIMKIDPDFFKVWPEFVAAGEALENFSPPDEPADPVRRAWRREELLLIRTGKRVIDYVADARVPVEQGRKRFLAACEELRNRRQ